MILDDLQNAAQYFGLGPGFERGLRWLAETDLARLPAGRHDIAGDHVFALVQEYLSKPKATGLWEAHRKYADIQMVVSGAEHLGYAPTPSLRADAYDESRDFLPLHGEGLFIEMDAGTFMILLPQDAHMPGMAIAAPAPVKKVVVKVKL